MVAFVGSQKAFTPAPHLPGQLRSRCYPSQREEKPTPVRGQGNVPGHPEPGVSLPSTTERQTPDLHALRKTPTTE